MKFYVAARVGQAELVKQICDYVVDKGHELSHDWHAAEVLHRPYGDNPEMASKFAVEDITGAKDADIFIIIGDKEGTGMYIEMGAALGAGAQIYAVGEYNDKTVFHFHPRVKRVDTIAEVFDDLCI